MKVVAALADSASVQELRFKKTVDTSKQSSELPEIEEVLPGPSTGNKKQAAITHFLRVDEDTIVVARKNGSIDKGTDTIAHLESAIVGLALLNEFVIVFSANGHSLAIGRSKTINFQLRNNLVCVVQDPSNPSKFASAGDEELPDVFELTIKKSAANTKVYWQATQPPNDMLDLPELNKVSAMTFVGVNLISVTSHGRLRVYDTTKESGQPDHMVQVTKDALKSITTDPANPGTVIIGDSRSTVSRWNVEPPKLLGHYKGVNGSTRCISVKGSFVALGGLDRYIRIFDIVKRQPAGKVYIGKEIWAIQLIRTDEDEDEDELDNFWDGIKRRKGGSKEEHLSTSKSISASKVEEEQESELDSEDFEADSGDSSGSSFEGFD